MQTVFVIIIAFAWLGGTLIRIYRQARFFQIEEYMNLRYLRWWLREREHWLPTRPLAAAFLGSVFALMLTDASDSFIPGIIGSIAGVVAVWPPDESEIKRKFRRTPRATRLLAASLFTTITTLSAVTFLLLGIDSQDIQVVGMTGIGLVIFIFAPLQLVLGNILMIPVEGFYRGRFIARARHVLAEVHPTIIGITGSYGKTTTKVFLADVLNARFHAYPTPKSYNTMMGICIAINSDLAQNYSIDYFIAEMGAYIRGEIERICDLTPPDIGVIVEIGPQHLERFGSLENVAAAKYEVIKALPPDGVGIFNWDNPYIREMYERGYPATRIAVSKAVSPDDTSPDGPRFVASDITQTLQGLTFTMTDRANEESVRLTTPVVGEHNVTNILLATAVAVHEGMSLQDVAFRARMLKPAESRLVHQATAQGITIINDAYSANPVGAISALDVLGMHTRGRRLVITPGMVELGSLQEQENHKLGVAIARIATDVMLVGETQTQPIKEGLVEAKFPAERMHIVEKLQEAISWYQHNLKSGDTVLFLNDLPDTYS